MSILEDLRARYGTRLVWLDQSSMGGGMGQHGVETAAKLIEAHTHREVTNQATIHAWCLSHPQYRHLLDKHGFLIET